MNDHLFVLSLLTHFCLPGDVVITINNSAITIIFNATSKSLVQKSQSGIALTFFIKIVVKELLKYEVKTLDGGT